MLDDDQIRLLTLLLLSVVAGAVGFGFVKALLTGEAGISSAPHTALDETVRRADQPGRYWRIMAGWAFMLILSLGLVGIPLFVM